MATDALTRIQAGRERVGLMAILARIPFQAPLVQPAGGRCQRCW